MEALKITQKIEMMIEYGYTALKHFPKAERHVMSQEIRTSMWDLLRLSVTLERKYHKKTTLHDTDIQISLLKRHIRLARTLEFLPKNKYRHWAEMLDEIGRMIGSWIKKMRQEGGGNGGR